MGVDNGYLLWLPKHKLDSEVFPAIQFFKDCPLLICKRSSGSLITPTYFLSAAHCNNILIAENKDKVSPGAGNDSYLCPD